MITYAVKEVFATLQGEGDWTGYPAVFLRLSGCNLWSGRESSRASAICKFCDTNFVDGEKKTVAELVSLVGTVGASIWPGRKDKVIVITGGEPMLQLDEELAGGLRGLDPGIRLHLETNGTIAVEPGLVDWITVSPKAGTKIAQRSGNELKVVVPQDGFDKYALDLMASWEFGAFYLSPKWDNDEGARRMYRQDTINRVLSTPPWVLSLQTHKWLGLR